MNEAERERQTPTFYVFVTALHLCLQPCLRYREISETSFLTSMLKKLHLERKRNAGQLCSLADELKVKIMSHPLSLTKGRLIVAG